MTNHFVDDHVVLDAILGVDALQFFTRFETVPVLNGVAFKLKNGSIVPFGNVDNFLSDFQVKETYKELSVESEGLHLGTITDFVLDPLETI